ncbi:hypothetical protein MPL3356_280076 [Mesorhizobium plurifarium]|uniref:Uncharacterized protein n=1 Tax=Mesorhizobium plurifarium TaxID=69974 RepID=A0A090DQ44_MESPL|nr:hypothetical protein MPL3356_280076 [Mesorhizobium plurifarium]
MTRTLAAANASGHESYFARLCLMDGYGRPVAWPPETKKGGNARPFLRIVRTGWISL